MFGSKHLLDLNQFENSSGQRRPESAEFVAPVVILASGSKNRISLFQKLGIPFQIIPSTVDEKSIRDADPIRKVQAIARLKAHNVAARNHGIIVAADTFTTINDIHYEKPVDVDDARRMMREFSGKKGKSVYGLCIINTTLGRERTSVHEVDIEVANLTDKVIHEYINALPVTEWAAAYNPLNETSAGIFRPVHGYIKGLEFGISLEDVIEELQIANIEVDRKQLAV